MHASDFLLLNYKELIATLIKTTRFHWSTCFYCCLVALFNVFYCCCLPNRKYCKFRSNALTVIWPRVQARCGRSILLIPGTGLTWQRRAPTIRVWKVHLSRTFPVTRSWQKVGDGFILTAAELLTRTDSRWHEMNQTERARRPRTRHKSTSRCFSLFLCRCCDFNVIWSGYAVLESCLERRADRKAAWRSWRRLSGTPSRL